MTKDDIIRMAREAGIECLMVRPEDMVLHRFAALVAAAEREACAEVADYMSDFAVPHNAVAIAIRARGSEPELEHITYKTAGAVLEEGFYSVDDLQDILKSLEDLNPRGNDA